MLDNFLFSFIPLFVAFDALGLLPLYINLTSRLNREQRNRHLRDSIITAFGIALVFVVIGNRIMMYLGITLRDFLIAGGIVLFIIAIKEILSGQEMPAAEQEKLGVVPLGVPLLTGPAVLATSMIVRNQYGFLYFILSLVINLVICAIVLRFSEHIVKLLGKRFIEAISKVFSLIIASIAVMFIRKGLQGM